MLTAVLAALPLAEFALRLGPDPTLAPVADEPTDSLWADDAWRSPPPKVFQADATLGYAYAATALADVRVAEHRGGAFRFRTNSYGLRRDDEIEMPKPAGTVRVLVLGDSQTSGYATNDETYPGHLEALVRARTGGQSVEVLNAGVDGYSPQQAYLWLRTYGAPLQPDLIIFAVYAGNDINDLMHHGVDAATIDDAAGLVSFFRTPLTWLDLHSELVRRVGPVAEAALDDTLAGLGLVVPDAPLVPQDALVRLLRECHGCWSQSVKQAIRARTAPANAETAYRRLSTLFGLLKKYAAEQDAAVAVLVIPTKDSSGDNRLISGRLHKESDCLRV